MAKSRALLFSPLAMVVLAFALRATFLFVSFHGQPAPSGSRYLVGAEVGSIAASLAAGHGFSSPLGVDSGPTAWTTPVYPFLLAGLFKTFGIYTFRASIAIRLLDILFSSITCYPVFLLGRDLFGRMVGAVAGWLWAFLPKAIFFSVLWVWDTSLSALILSVCLLATYTVSECSSGRSWAGYGAFWGLATLVNAAILSVFPGSVLFLAFRARRRGARWLWLTTLALLGFTVTLSPWIIRNQLVFQGKVLLRSNFGLELWLGNNPEVPTSWSWWLHPTDSGEEKAEFLRLGEIRYMREKKSAAIEFMTAHPANTLRFQYHRFMETWTGYGEPFLDIWRGAKPALRSELLLNYSITLLTLVGMLLARRRIPTESFPFLNIIAFFPAVYYLTHTTPRYRHPMDPVITLLAAYAAVSLVRYVAERIAQTRTDHRHEIVHSQ